MKLIDLEHKSRKHPGTESTYHRAVRAWSATVCIVCLVCCSGTERASTQEHSHYPTRGPSRDGSRESTTRSCRCCRCFWVCTSATFKLRNCAVSRFTTPSSPFIGFSKKNDDGGILIF